LFTSGFFYTLSIAVDGQLYSSLTFIDIVKLCAILGNIKRISKW